MKNNVLSLLVGICLTTIATLPTASAWNGGCGGGGGWNGGGYRGGWNGGGYGWNGGCQTYRAANGVYGCPTTWVSYNYGGCYGGYGGGYYNGYYPPAPVLPVATYPPSGIGVSLFGLNILGINPTLPVAVPAQ